MSKDQIALVIRLLADNAAASKRYSKKVSKEGRLSLAFSYQFEADAYLHAAKILAFHSRNQSILERIPKL
jgi:hypothetical protein